MKCVNECGHELGACGAQGVAECDSAAIYIQFLRVSSGVLEPRHWDRGESLIHFIQVHILNSHACAFECTVGRKEGFLKHDHRITRGHSEVMNARQWCEVVVFKCLFGRYHNRGATIANLTRISCGERTVFHQDFQLCHGLHAGVISNALVMSMQR